MFFFTTTTLCIKEDCQVRPFFSTTRYQFTLPYEPKSWLRIFWMVNTLKRLAAAPPWRAMSIRLAIYFLNKNSCEQTSLHPPPALETHGCGTLGKYKSQPWHDLHPPNCIIDAAAVPLQSKQLLQGPLSLAFNTRPHPFGFDASFCLVLTATFI